MTRAGTSKKFGTATCKECGREFTKHRWAQNYCSGRCANIAKQRRKRKRQKSAKKSGVLLEPRILAGVPHLEVVSRAQKSGGNPRGFRAKKMHLYLFDEAPSIGCGWRLLTVTMGRKWVRLLDHHSGHKKRISLDLFRNIVSASEQCARRNGRVAVAVPTMPVSEAAA